MQTVAVTAEEANFIRERIANFAEEAPEPIRWQCEHVLQHRALPLYLGWTETLAIRADGTLVRWSIEDAWPGAREFVEPMWRNVALVQGALRYPQLQRLVPARPSDATDCEACNGAGKIKGLPLDIDVMCKCAGLGWLPHELPPESPP